MSDALTTLHSDDGELDKQRVARILELQAALARMEDWHAVAMDLQQLRESADSFEHALQIELRENAAMREIVQAVAESDPEVSHDHGLTVVCAYCDGRRQYPDEGEIFLDHTADCPFIKARALLAKDK